MSGGHRRWRHLRATIRSAANPSEANPSAANASAAIPLAAVLLGAVLLAAALFVAAAPAEAQNFGVTGQDAEPLPDFSQNAQDEVIGGGVTVETLEIGPGARSAPRDAPAVATQDASGAVLRGLDKITGDTVDFDLDNGGEARLGRLTVTLQACRSPQNNPSGDAFALLTVVADGQDNPWFRGWMIASAPALSALDHPRYDVWVMRCRSS